MLPVSVDDAGMNLAGDNNGRSRCEEEMCATVLRCRTASATGRLACSADVPNGPIQLHMFM